MKLPEKEKSTSFYMGLLLGSLILIIAGPLISLWAINTLFSTGIEYSVVNWLATVWLTILIVGSARSKK